MCYAAYIGSNYKQSTKTFIADQTVLYLEELSQEKEITGLRSKFSTKYIYYVGSYQGCSCGFACDPTEFEEQDDHDKKEKNQAFKSVDALLSLIVNLTRQESIQFYCCWEGDWEAPIEERIVLDITKIKIGTNYFGLSEKQFILFSQQENVDKKI